MSLKIFIIIIILTYNAIQCIAINHNEVRTRFIKSIKDEPTLIDLLADLKKELPSNDALLNSYYGACKGLSARNTNNIFNKLSYVKESLRYLDKGVELEPSNTELRILRLNIEQHIPAIAGFKLHVTQDVNFLKSYLFNVNISAKNIKYFESILPVFKKNNYIKKEDLITLELKLNNFKKT